MRNIRIPNIYTPVITLNVVVYVYTYVLYNFSLKVKINKTPTDLDDQPVPKTLTRLLSWKNKDRNGLIRDPERKKKPDKAPKGLTKVLKKHGSS